MPEGEEKPQLTTNLCNKQSGEQSKKTKTLEEPSTSKETNVEQQAPRLLHVSSRKRKPPDRHGVY